MADEVNMSFLLPGPPATHVAAWRSAPPPFLDDYKRVDESYESLVYEADVTTTFMKCGDVRHGQDALPPVVHVP